MTASFKVELRPMLITVNFREMAFATPSMALASPFNTYCTASAPRLRKWEQILFLRSLHSYQQPKSFALRARRLTWNAR